MSVQTQFFPPNQHSQDVEILCYHCKDSKLPNGDMEREKQWKEISKTAHFNTLFLNG